MKRIFSTLWQRHSTAVGSTTGAQRTSRVSNMLLSCLSAITPAPIRNRVISWYNDFDLLDHVSVKEFYDRSFHLQFRDTREWIAIHESRLKRAERFVEEREGAAIRRMVEHNREMMKAFGVEMDKVDQEEMVRDERVFMFQQMKLSRAKRFIQAEEMSRLEGPSQYNEGQELHPKNKNKNKNKNKKSKEIESLEDE